MPSANIPFSPIPTANLLVIARRFRSTGARVARQFPYLKIDMRQAGLSFEEEEYGAMMLFICMFYALFGFFITLVLGLKFFPDKALIAAPTAGLLCAILILVQLSLYPKMVVKRKVRDTEKNLVFALRTILVEIRSGVSLFDAINMIGNGSYGEVSTEFRKALEKINTGSLEDEALEEIATDNPSTFFRRTIWQLVNGLKAGSDISDIMASLVETLMKEQMIQIRDYGGKLRMLSLVYMMLGVIIPALGITFLIILSSFPQIGVGELLFWVLFWGIGIAQFMYIGVIKSSRPNLMPD